MSEDNMITNKSFWIVIITLLCTANQAYSQPFYLYHASDSTGFWKFNLLNSTKDQFYSDTANSNGNISWDPTQRWAFIITDNSNLGKSIFDKGRNDYYISIKAIQWNNASNFHLFPDQYPHSSGTTSNSFYDGSDRRGQVVDGIVYNSVKNSFYVTWCLPHPDSIVTWPELAKYQRTVEYDAMTFAVLDTLPAPPRWINSLSSISEDGNYLYVEYCDYYKNKTNSIGKYSLATKQLIIHRDLTDIVVNGGYKDVDDSKKGKYLLQYLYPSLSLSDKNYALYDIDRDSTCCIIPFSLVANGSISSDAKYVIIEETPVRPDYANSTSGDDFLHPGRISVFSGMTGHLIQKLSLPPNGKVLVFDDYPNMLYYYLPKEQRSINIDLSKLSAISSISPSAAFAGTCPFTLTVTGKNFKTNSIVNWAGAPKTTTFISDSILQASVLASDIAAIDTPLVTIKTPDGAESNGIRFLIRPGSAAPGITLLSQNLALSGSDSFTLVAAGTNYDSTSRILWNGTAHVTQYVSPKQLRATILDADVTASGQATIAVAYQNCIASASSSFFVADVALSVLVDSLISKKHQCYALHWLTDRNVERRLDRKLERAKQLLRMSAEWPLRPSTIDALSEAIKEVKDDDEESSKEYGRDVVRETPRTELEEDKLKECKEVEQEMSIKPREGKKEKMLESQRKSVCRDAFLWSAKKVLQSFVRELEILNKLSEKGRRQHLTSEAYALMKYNALYVIDQLPEKKRK